MRSSNTGAAVLDWLVSDGELAQIMTTHLRLQRKETQVSKRNGTNKLYVTENYN